MGWEAALGSGRAWAACCPPGPCGRLRYQKQKRFLPTPAGPEVQAAPPSPVSYLRYATPRTLGVPGWGACWQREVLGEPPLLASMGGGSRIILCHRAGPCWNFTCPALGPKEMVVWAIRGLPGTIHSPRAWGAAPTLAEGTPRRCPSPGDLWWLPNQFCWEPLFTWNQTSSRWFGPVHV